MAWAPLTVATQRGLRVRNRNLDDEIRTAAFELLRQRDAS